ncbi:MAG TPA: hypothetical protein VIK83_05240, partial [Coriobacteriia bacterium]
MSMAAIRTGLAVVPQEQWESLFTANAPANHRCRDCASFADPTATHSDCTIRGIRKAGYAGACKKRIPRGHDITQPEQHLCVDCGADISHKKRGALVCEKCREIRDGHRGAGRVGAVNPFRTFRINPSMGPKPVRTRKDMSMTKHHDVPSVWTPEEDAMLSEFAHEGCAAVAERLGRTSSGIQQRASKLHVSLAKRKADHPLSTEFSSRPVGLSEEDMTPAEMIAAIAEDETCPDSL